MKNHFRFWVWLLLACLLLITVPGRGATTQITAKRLIQLDKMGAFPPDFKEAVHAYVDVKRAIVDGLAEEKKTRSLIPGMEQKARDEQAKVDDLNQVLADYNHTDETDFATLQLKMSDTAAKPKEQLMLAQIFVWSYPSSPHFPQAQTYLQQVQKQISDELQAEKDAEAAKAAAWATLLQRVHDKSLSMTEWRSFLNNMSQDDVIKYMGAPPQKAGYYWLYPGEWILDPEMNRKVGLRLNFNGGRVIGVTEYDTGAPAQAAPATSTNVE